MSTHEDKVQAAIGGLTGPLDFADAEIVAQPCKATVGYSVRLSGGLATRIAEVAEQRGTTASDAVRDLLVLGLASLDEDRVITVHTADLRRLVEQFVTDNRIRKLSRRPPRQGRPGHDSDPVVAGERYIQCREGHLKGIRPQTGALKVVI